MKSIFDYILYVFLIVVCILAILTMIMNWVKNWKERKRAKQRANMPAAQSAQYDNVDNPTLMKRLLEKLNCQYKENEDGSLFFQYQGEHFWMQSSNDSAWVRVIDLQWYDCSLDQLEEMSCMQKAINSINSGQICSAVYSIDKDENKMEVYSKYDFVMTSAIPSADQLLASVLANFFRLKQAVVTEFEKEKQRIGVE